MGIFVVFEGGEGSGKSTQSRLLYQRLLQEGHPTVLLHEPGGTPLGEQVRRLLKSQQGGAQSTPRAKRRSVIGPLAELLLFSATRAQLIEEVLLPTLKEGRNVVCDRYAPSTVAYQGYGRGLPLATIDQINRITTTGLKPNLVVLLDIEPKERLRRVEAQTSRAPAAADPIAHRMDEEGHRRFEEEPLSFHQKVRRGYLEMAKADPDRWLVVDATLPPNEIAALVWRRVEPILNSRER